MPVKNKSLNPELAKMQETNAAKIKELQKLSDKVGAKKKK